MADFFRPIAKMTALDAAECKTRVNKFFLLTLGKKMTVGGKIPLVFYIVFI
jgi:hypothetical protein